MALIKQLSSYLDKTYFSLHLPDSGWLPFSDIEKCHEFLKGFDVK
jgi:hypothetical protein